MTVWTIYKPPIVWKTQRREHLIARKKFDYNDNEYINKKKYKMNRNRPSIVGTK